MSDAPRPEPDALLKEASREGRGKLKIFLGAAPGVGKTYAMLEAARRRASDGEDVLAGVVETHGRAETESMLRELRVLPRQPFYHRGRILHEMDLEGLIAAKPDLALIDELAHSNLSGNRHEKRWQDVEEVLSAGIDVYTTLNVQHVETLNDTVARITGVRVRETVPDRVLEIADEIELIDLPPDELLERLRAGKVYIQDQAARAVTNFFAKGNLTALRELAMRTAADRVDAELKQHMAANAIAGPWPTQERILVVLPEEAVGRDAVRIGKRSADRARVEWFAMALTSLRDEIRTTTVQQGRADALRLAERLGAEVTTQQAERHQAEEVVSFAERLNIRRIVVPRPPPRNSLLRHFAPTQHEQLVSDLVRWATKFELTLVTDDERPARRRLRPKPPPMPDMLRMLGIVLFAVAGTTLLAKAAELFIPVVSLSLLYMTTVVAIATRFGRGPSITTAGLSFLAYNFLFTTPVYTFHIWDQSQLLTLVLFLAASILTGNLAARLRDRAIAQRAIAERTGKLYEFSRRAAAAASFDDVVWAAVSHVATVLNCQSILLVPKEAVGLTIVGAFPPEDRLADREISAARYCFTHGEAAGHGSGTLPTSRWLFLPLSASDRRIGVLGIFFPDGQETAHSDRRLLEALADQVALALERIRLTEDLAQTRVVSEAERLRSSLLSSVSHDLRTPLVSILGAAEGLENPGLSPDAQRILVETVREEGERLDRYIQNLLDMTRLGHGALKPNAIPSDLRELVGMARHRLRGPLRDHPVSVQMPEDMAPVHADPVLMEQVLVNILDNAAKYSGPATPIRISAEVRGAHALLSIEDDGPGLPPGAADRVFDMFWRAEQGDRGQAGTGLGLAICRGIVEAHRGSIRAGSAHSGEQGTRIVIELPLSNPETFL
ncbi:sensor histidine kinase [Paracoccus saliphilus]|uniref:histidine kinase n=1 Tax=Paracoccus saliphilus TaxID=405559 RepID=A0AA45W2T6_9RHOB|nr:sensor histidine kinase KdpD [Paracoccus saliphilus]WCR05068.1 sensor histidine kinase KdpD [Paracoccus saliphilus]SIS70543.1 two-component system, OmpR family, sensor histidine kinase KdpD [Paracoccus saliphilus]